MFDVGHVVIVCDVMCSTKIAVSDVSCSLVCNARMTHTHTHTQIVISLRTSFLMSVMSTISFYAARCLWGFKGWFWWSRTFMIQKCHDFFYRTAYPGSALKPSFLHNWSHTLAQPSCLHNYYILYNKLHYILDVFATFGQKQKKTSRKQKKQKKQNCKTHVGTSWWVRVCNFVFFVFFCFLDVFATFGQKPKKPRENQKKQKKTKKTKLQDPCRYKLVS